MNTTPPMPIARSMHTCSRSQDRYASAGNGVTEMPRPEKQLGTCLNCGRPRVELDEKKTCRRCANLVRSRQRDPRYRPVTQVYIESDWKPRALAGDVEAADHGDSWPAHDLRGDRGNPGSGMVASGGEDLLAASCAKACCKYFPALSCSPLFSKCRAAANFVLVFGGRSATPGSLFHC